MVEFGFKAVSCRRGRFQPLTRWVKGHGEGDRRKAEGKLRVGLHAVRAYYATLPCSDYGEDLLPFIW